MATLQHLDRLKVDFSVPEKYASRLRAGSPIQLTIVGGDRRFDGAIYAIDPRIDSATRTVLIRAVCPNKEGRLFPGAFASVSLTLGEIDNAVLVPAIAVVPGLNAKTVFVVKDGKALLRKVVTGTRLEERVQILAGLEPGEVVGHVRSAATQPGPEGAAACAGVGRLVTLAEVSIRRPVFTIVISLLILLFGVVSLTRLGVREYPSVDPPTISITTSYPGAAAEIVQAQITEPIEEAVNTVAGIETLTSNSREGTSTITAQFSLDTNLEAAASDTRDALSRVVRQLPPDIDPPIVSKADADANPIFGISLSSDRRTQLELGGYADELRERLQTVPGIAQVDQPAEKRFAMRLWMDPEKLAAYDLTPLDVRAALNRENVELPSGRIEGASVELPVKALSRLTTPAEFNAITIKRSADGVVRFQDIGYAELGAQNERSSLKVGSTPIAGLYFRQQPGANQIEIVDELRRRIGQIRKEVPSDIHLEIAFDNTAYVRRSLLEVSETIFIAFALVVLVVFAFLREWRTTLIPVLAIPVSIVGTFAVMNVAGFSINTLTLLGIVLAIGLVVDDAIVVLENIYSKIEAGMAPQEAGIAGTKEIFLAVISTTITLAIVFLPLLFMGGLSGRLFREFGVTICRRGHHLGRRCAHSHADAQHAPPEATSGARLALPGY